MSLTYHTGDLFDSEAEVLGHGVNCRGLMGAGIAKAFRAASEDMYQEYRMLCEEGLLKPGGIYPYRIPVDKFMINKYIMNIASQDQPGPDARAMWLFVGMIAALKFMDNRGLTSIAIPRIGCGIGGLDWDEVKPRLEILASIYDDIEIEVWTL